MNTGFFADLMLGRTALLRLDMDSARSYLDQAERQYNETIWFKDDLFYLLAPALAHTARLEGRFSEARRLYADSLRRMHAVQHFLYAPESLEGLAMLELEAGQGSSAACLFGAAQALRERLGTPPPPVRQAEYRIYLERLRQALTGADFERSWSAGRGMSFEDLLISA
jgi:hypothetical protein